MAKAKKLPSGSWRCLVYSHSETVLDDKGNTVYDKDGKPKKKRIYESFTSDDPSPRGKAEAELLAAQFAVKKENAHKPSNMTLREAINLYIDSSDALLSPTTIQGYRKIQRNAFVDIMDMPIKKISNDLFKQAVNREKKRPSKKNKKDIKPIKAKTLINEYGLIITVLREYNPSGGYSVSLPEQEAEFKELLPPDVIFNVVKGKDIELPVLLAMWLSFSMSEVRGLTKSKSVQNGYIIINDVVVDVDNKPMRKNQAKEPTRKRKHKIPHYIQELIDKTDPGVDELVPMSGHAIYMRWTRLLQKNDLPHMSFHDLRHVNASVMALLRIPDKYAQERGGWKTDKIMKKVYMQTFSEERERVDALIDNYFEQSMQHEMQHKK